MKFGSFNLIMFCFFVALLDADQQTILVTGGAGYIGSHTVYLLAQQGHKLIVLDDFGYGQLDVVGTWATVIHGDYGDSQLLHDLFSRYSIAAVIHFAGFIAVGESVQNPLKYYDNNVSKTINLLHCMREHNVDTIIFSSSAAVYGIPNKIPILEEHITNPINPYGHTKLMVEYILQDCSRAYGLKFVALRYFNACGAQPEVGLGEYHVPETHLIPLALRAAMYDTTFSIFGDDYATPDGTCIRDYLHVSDLASAHVQALYYLKQGGSSTVFNLGTGIGYSVRQVLDVVNAITGKKIKCAIQKRRAGDPAVLIADAGKAEKVLGWKACRSDLRSIVESAYKFVSYGYQNRE